MFQEFKPALLMFIVMSILTGLAYPALVTVIAQTVFPSQAAGSLIRVNGKVAGSHLVGQPFSAPRHFWSRLSATGPTPYNGALSGGANLGPLNPALAAAVEARIATLHASDPQQTAPIPVDLVTTSASGLDPHISPAAALWQAPRVARESGLALATVEALIAEHTESRQFGVLGEARVNVLRLNRALRAAQP